MLASRVENPPLGMVVNAWLTESNTVMPPMNLSANISTSVSSKYRPQRAIAVCRNLGRSRERDGPVSSARARAMPPPMMRESTSIPSITTPMPPSHCVKERQSNKPCGCALMQSGVVPGMQLGLIECDSTVAPEVVNPDMDSNHEFTNPRMMSMASASSTKGPTNTPPNQ